MVVQAEGAAARPFKLMQTFPGQYETTFILQQPRSSTVNLPSHNSIHVPPDHAPSLHSCLRSPPVHTPIKAAGHNESPYPDHSLSGVC